MKRGLFFRTILIMELVNLETVLPAANDIVVELVPQREGGELWTRELCYRA